MKKTLSLTSLLLVGGILALFSLFSAQAVFAQEGTDTSESITITPAVARPTINAGESLSAEFTVINDGQAEYNFSVYARPFSVQGEQYDPNFTEVNAMTQAFEWVTFERTTFTLGAGERISVPYTVNSPVSAAAGGHYAVLFAETEPKDSDSTNVLRKKRVGSLLYMTVNGEASEDGSIASWDAKLWQTTKPITSSLRIENTGNVHFQADVHVNYSNLFGNKRFELNQELLILPGTTRKVPIDWVDSPSIGIYKAEGTVDYLGETEELPAKYIILLPMVVVWTVLGVIILLVTATIFRKKRLGKKSKKVSNE